MKSLLIARSLAPFAALALASTVATATPLADFKAATAIGKLQYCSAVYAAKAEFVYRNLSAGGDFLRQSKVEKASEYALTSATAAATFLRLSTRTISSLVSPDAIDAHARRISVEVENGLDVYAQYADVETNYCLPLLQVHLGDNDLSQTELEAIVNAAEPAAAIRFQEAVKAGLTIRNAAAAKELAEATQTMRIRTEEQLKATTLR